jgi:hypothetical protein
VFPVPTAAARTQILSFSFFIREVPGDDNEDAHFYVLRILTPKNSDRYWRLLQKRASKREIKGLSCIMGILRGRETRSIHAAFVIPHTEHFPPTNQSNNKKKEENLNSVQSYKALRS